MASITQPYAGALSLINKKDIPTWVNEFDGARLAAYELYQSIYWTEPGVFKLQQRGSNDVPVYIPSGRTICNTMDRYTGVDMVPIMDAAYGTPEQQAQALMVLSDFFKRERFASNYESNKLFGIVKGDWAWYITANPNKPALSRLSLKPIDMSLVFPIEDPNDVDRILGVDIVEEIMIGADARLKRTRYLKSEHPDYGFGGAGEPGGPISMETVALEIAEWETNPKPVAYDGEVPEFQLPKEITNLPVYWIPNFDEPGNLFGSSEMRGIERLFAAINQTVSDEELTLALEGLGMWKSSNGAPASGFWDLGPGKVVHDDSFERISGVNTVGPFQDHVKYLHSQIDQVSGVSDVAKGIVDVSVAESGVALKLRMGPILGSSNKKDKIIRAVHDQMLFDLRSWFKAYEGLDMEAVRPITNFGQKMPEDNKDRFDKLLQMYSADPPLITAAYFRDACREMGMAIPMDITGATIAAERAQMAEAMDPYGARLNEEMEAGAGEVDPEAEPEVV